MRGPVRPRDTGTGQCLTDLLDPERFYFFYITLFTFSLFAVDRPAVAWSVSRFLVLGHRNGDRHTGGRKTPNKAEVPGRNCRHECSSEEEDIFIDSIFGLKWLNRESYRSHSLFAHVHTCAVLSIVTQQPPCLVPFASISPLTSLSAPIIISSLLIILRFFSETLN